MGGYPKRSIHSLSYGEKKRICLAGVLAMKPRVMLLDEPTSSLDPMAMSDIMHLLKRLNKEERITMVMATHSVDLIPIFVDRVVILSGGKVLHHGPPEKVFADKHMIRRERLRLPRIAHLMEILKNKDCFEIDQLPLTIGEARQRLVKYFKRRAL
jgi:energy-coupling factor transporter ATP-binding protein EcfA2